LLYWSIIDSIAEDFGIDDDTNGGLILGIMECAGDNDKRDDDDDDGDDPDNGQENDNE